MTDAKRNDWLPVNCGRCGKGLQIALEELLDKVDCGVLSV